MSFPPFECRHMLARLVLIILLQAPDGSTHAENITSKTFACDLNPSLLLHHANATVKRHYLMILDWNICTAQFIFPYLGDIKSAHFAWLVQMNDICWIKSSSQGMTQNSLDLDFYLDLQQIAETLKYQSTKHVFILSISMKYSLWNQLIYCPTRIRICTATFFLTLFRIFSSISTDLVRTIRPHWDQSLIILRQNVISELLV